MRCKALLSGKLFWELWADRLFTLASWILGGLGLFLPVSIVGFLIYRGVQAISWSFLVDAPKGFPLGLEGGIRPAIEGSLALIALGLAIAVPFGVGGAIYLSEYGASSSWERMARFAAECLAAIPSIIYGLFGYSFLVVYMSLKISLVAGGITLGLLMFPLILIGAHEAMQAVDRAYRESALSLGVSRLYVARRIILTKAWPGIVAATVLAAGHAVGSAAPVLFTASVIFSRGGLDLTAPVMTLPTHLYYLVSEASSPEQTYGTAVILIIGLLLSNSVATLAKGWKQ